MGEILDRDAAPVFSRWASSSSRMSCCSHALHDVRVLFTITLMTFALAGLALALGTLFRSFETENAAQIPTSFGGWST